MIYNSEQCSLSISGADILFTEVFMENNKPLKVAVYFTLFRDESSTAIEKELRDHYDKILNDNPEVEYVGCYVDYFTKVNKDIYDVSNFQLMMKDAALWKINAIIIPDRKTFFRAFLYPAFIFEQKDRFFYHIRLYFEEDYDHPEAPFSPDSNYFIYMDGDELKKAFIAESSRLITRYKFGRYFKRSNINKEFESKLPDDVLCNFGYVRIPREALGRMRVCVYGREKENVTEYSTFNYMRECVKKNPDYRLVGSYVDIDYGNSEDLEQFDITEFKKMMEKARNYEFYTIYTISLAAFMKAFVRLAAFEEIEQYMLPINIYSASEHIETRMDSLNFLLYFLGEYIDLRFDKHWRKYFDEMKLDMEEED